MKFTPANKPNFAAIIGGVLPSVQHVLDVAFSGAARTSREQYHLVDARMAVESGYQTCANKHGIMLSQLVQAIQTPTGPRTLLQNVDRLATRDCSGADVVRDLHDYINAEWTHETRKGTNEINRNKGDIKRDALELQIWAMKPLEFRTIIADEIIQQMYNVRTKVKVFEGKEDEGAPFWGEIDVRRIPSDPFVLMRIRSLIISAADVPLSYGITLPQLDERYKRWLSKRQEHQALAGQIKVEVPRKEMLRQLVERHNTTTAAYIEFPEIDMKVPDLDNSGLMSAAARRAHEFGKMSTSAFVEGVLNHGTVSSA
jgi:hypothetical protein